MKKSKSFFGLLTITSLFVLCLLASCSSNNTGKANETKADSLEKRTKYLMDSANEATMKQINSMSDSDIINSDEPVEKEKH